MVALNCYMYLLTEYVSNCFICWYLFRDCCFKIFVKYLKIDIICSTTIAYIYILECKKDKLILFSTITKLSVWTESTQIIFVYLFPLSINIESNLAVWKIYSWTWECRRYTVEPGCVGDIQSSMNVYKIYSRTRLCRKPRDLK